MKHRPDFERPNGHRVYCIRAREDTEHGEVEVIVLPAKGKGYHLFPKHGDIARTLLRDVGVPDYALERVAAALSATVLLRKAPPWETTETEIRTFTNATEALQ